MFLNKFFNFGETVDLSVRWIYIAFLTNIIVSFSQMIFNYIILHRNLQSRIIFLPLYSILFIVDEVFFVFAIKTSPRKFQSFNFSILTPLILFLTSVTCAILYAIKALRAINLIRVIIDFIPGMITLIFIKVAFGFCYGSSVCFILVIEDFALTILKALLLPDRYKVIKKKLD